MDRIISYLYLDKLLGQSLLVGISVLVGWWLEAFWPLLLLSVGVVMILRAHQMSKEAGR